MTSSQFYGIIATQYICTASILISMGKQSKGIAIVIMGCILALFSLITHKKKENETENETEEMEKFNRDF